MLLIRILKGGNIMVVSKNPKLFAHYPVNTKITTFLGSGYDRHGDENTVLIRIDPDIGRQE